MGFGQVSQVGERRKVGAGAEPVHQERDRLATALRDGLLVPDSQRLLRAPVPDDP